MVGIATTATDYSAFISCWFGVRYSIAIKKQGIDKAFPFGPYVAIAGWIALLWGREIIDSLLLLIGVLNDGISDWQPERYRKRKNYCHNMFRDQFGIEIVDADVIARQVVEKGSIGLEAIHQHFGDEGS